MIGNKQSLDRIFCDMPSNYFLDLVEQTGSKQQFSFVDQKKSRVGSSLAFHGTMFYLR